MFRLDESGKLDRIYTFTADDYLPYRMPAMSAPHFLPLSTTRDGQGKIWIWCGWSWPGGPRGAALDGFLVTDGKTVQYHWRIPGLPNAHLVSIDVWDSGHLAAATFGGGLYTIDTATFEAHPVSEPQPGAFRFVKRVFRAGNDRYVLTFDPNMNRGMGPGAPGAVWRLRDGQWRQVLQSIRDASGVGLATASGLWLATSNFRGVWFVPRNGPARRIDWRDGFPLASVRLLFQLPGGNILATGAGQFASTRSVEFRPASVLAQPKPSTTFSVIHPTSRLEPGRHHNLWGLLQSGVLSEWNGSKWIPHPFPTAMQPSRIIRLDFDTLGRVWLFPNCSLGPMGFFDPEQNCWTAFRNYRTALSDRARPVEFLHPEDDRMRPIYGPRFQIVFVGPCAGVNYFDGQHWRLWNNAQLPSGNRDISIPPFFDSSGHVALSINCDTWQWEPATGWKQTSEGPPENYVRLPPDAFAPLPPLPAGCETLAPSSLIRDASGRAWWVADDGLYEGVTGRCRLVLSGSAEQPFIDGRRLAKALLDARGDVFLETQTPFSDVILRPSLYVGTRN